METINCPICKLGDTIENPVSLSDASVITCKRCGKYMMDGLMRRTFTPADFAPEDKRLLPYLSAYTRQASERGEIPRLDYDNWRDFAQQHRPKNEEQKTVNLLVSIRDMTESELGAGSGIEFDTDLDYPLAAANSENECFQLLNDITELGYVETRHHVGYVFEVTLLPKGRRYLEKNSQQSVGEVQNVATPDVPRYEYISHERLAELRAIQSADFDLQRLIRLCEEINICFHNECWLAVASHTRTLINHVPPIFGKSTFSEVVNNYSGGGRSFKDSMQHLNSSRFIGDSQLHMQIRRSDSLPNKTQVDFKNGVDVLLGEIVRILK